MTEPRPTVKRFVSAAVRAESERAGAERDEPIAERIL
jgi:hypothetical protein